MPSHALIRWREQRSVELDEIAAAHEAVGGTGRGRRYATKQINHAYLVLLSSQFQGFCRDLHSEVVDILAASMSNPVLRSMLSDQLTESRKLDRGNPWPGNLGSDFGRFKLKFWPRLYALDGRNREREEKLRVLADWRNAIAHQDFSSGGLPDDGTLHLVQVKRSRNACDRLAVSFDEVMRRFLAEILGSTPW